MKNILKKKARHIVSKHGKHELLHIQQCACCQALFQQLKDEQVLFNVSDIDHEAA